MYWKNRFYLFFCSGGLIRVQRTASDSENGPKFFLRVDTGETKPSIEAEISGYSYVLGMSGEITLRIKDNLIMFNMTGTPWPGILTANLYAQATWSPPKIGFEVLCVTF